MRIRRVLWLCLSGLFGWALYLYLPPKPAWSLPENELPLRFAAGKLLTAVPVKAESRAVFHLEPELAKSPIHVRELRSGRILSTVVPSGEEGCPLLSSFDLRFVVIAKHERSAFSVVDTLHDTRWDVPTGIPLRFTPNGTFVVVRLPDNSLCVRDSATGGFVFQSPGQFECVDAAADDSVVLFRKHAPSGVEKSNELLIWRRGQNAPIAKHWPGPIEECKLSADGRFAAIWLRSVARFVLWNLDTDHICYEHSPLPSVDGVTIEFSPDSRTLLVGWLKDRRPWMLVDVATGAITEIEPTIHGWAAAWSPDSQRIVIEQMALPASNGAAGEQKSELLVLNRSTGKLLWRLTRTPDQDEAAPNCRWLDNGRALYATNLESAPAIFDADSGKKRTDNVGEIFDDERYCVDTEVVPLRVALGIPTWFGNLIPALEKQHRTRIRVRDTSRRRHVGELHFDADRLTIVYDKPISFPTPSRSVLHLASGILVVNEDHRFTQFWILPLSKPWLWILGPPLGLAALPWLRKLVRRKRPSPAAGQTPVPAPSSA